MTRFTQDDAFPVIVRLITDLHRKTGDFVTHDELVSAFVNDATGRALVENAREADNRQKDLHWWASNMIQWFSQKITEGKSEYQSQFERRRINNSWAYRPMPDQPT